MHGLSSSTSTSSYTEEAILDAMIIVAAVDSSSGVEKQSSSKAHNVKLTSSIDGATGSLRL